jgi:type I restriction enzyme M protein
LEGRAPHLGYVVATKNISNYVLAPRYYDPSSEVELAKLEATHNLVRVSDLVERGVLEFSTGDEIGKMAYGTGEVPFVRTSDIANWEIKADPKHVVSREVYEQYAKKQDIREGDILMVRDGTYLIGTCAFISKYDTQIVYQSHLYKIRVKDASVISPYLLLAALSSAPVIKQIHAKRFTQDIIDTLGKRVFELVLPIPKDTKRRAEIENMVKDSIHDRIESRELARKAKLAIVDLGS